MYKAIHKVTDEEIIILSPAWRKKIDRLREMDRQDLLLCQRCRQPLRVKAGKLKRPHFAHKHLRACSCGTESPEILNARAVLYTWLVKQFGADVNLEKDLPEKTLPRPVDGWVTTDSGALAYWIIEAGIRLDVRQAIKSALETVGIKTHWIFLRKLLKEDTREYQSVLLTPTERAFMKLTPFDAMEAGAGEPGGSLHYLDADEERLITYRALALFHRPNWFRGIKKSTLLENVLASSMDGEMVHPGEITRLNSIREKLKRRERKREQFQAREHEWEHRLQSQWSDDHSPPLQPKRSESAVLNDPGDAIPLPCALCGQLTIDYWSTFFDHNGRKLCRCRECLKRES